ncbi:unnamed protein product [Leuciscus chuanchicus]
MLGLGTRPGRRPSVTVERSCNNSQWLVNGLSFAPPFMNIKQYGKSETSARRGREICQNIRGVDRQKNT